MINKYFRNIKSSNFDFIFEHSESLFLIISDKNGIVLNHSKSVHKITHNQGIFNGKPVSGILHENDIQELFKADPKTTKILQVKPDEQYWKVYYLKNRNEYIIIGERIGYSESTSMNQMVTLTNEIANLGRELQKKNRELKQANDKITILARIDPLTQLYNRRYFQEIFSQNIALAERHNTPVTLILSDIDHFKSINDTYGHDAGDEVLKQFSSILMNNIRKEDLPVRFGGEEFVLLLQNSDGKAGLQAAEKIRALLEKTEIIRGRQVTASFGVAEYYCGDTAEMVLKHADESLYKSKNSGRNKVTLYTPLARATA